jgi:DNA-binding transcriptional ArsR family regulator
MAETEEEIYSIMFTSLKHPVRRKILRMLSDKPLTFTEMVEQLSVSSSHLTYHLESLGELILKMEEGRYKLSTFGDATINAMKGVEDAPQIETKRHGKLGLKWRATIGALLIVVICLATFATIQYTALNQQDAINAENQQLLQWGIGTNKVANLLQNVAQIDTAKYKITLLSNTLEYRQDFKVAEETLKYSLTAATSYLDADLRFRDNHFSKYQLTQIESDSIATTAQAADILETAKTTLDRYKAYSGDAYLDEMSSLLTTATSAENTSVTEGNMKLQITLTGDKAEFLWMYTEKGIDFNSKSLRMTFQNHVLTAMTDGYFLFTIANTNLDVTQEEAVTIARNYVKTLSWTIDGQQTTGFSTTGDPVSVELVPHPRANSAALVPYWYIVLHLDKIYSGGINQVAIGVYADNGEVANVQMLSR